MTLSSSYYYKADSSNNNSNSIKGSNFLFLAKKQKPTNETTYFVKDFSLFTKFNSNPVPYLALYKEDQATH